MKPNSEKKIYRKPDSFLLKLRWIQCYRSHTDFHKVYFGSYSSRLFILMEMCILMATDCLWNPVKTIDSHVKTKQYQNTHYPEID